MKSKSVLKKGTQIKIFGYPLTILEDVEIDISRKYLNKILKKQKNKIIKIFLIYKLSFSHLEPFELKPFQAPSPVRPATISSSS